MEETEDLKGSVCVMPDKPVIVGTDWHRFKGPGDLCTGVLGNGSNQECGLPRYAEIHSDDKKPQWIKDAEKQKTIPDSGLKDSGARLQFSSGMVRDTDADKPAFDLILPEGIPFREQMLTRWADLLRKGAIKYSRRNWEKADSKEELDRAKASAFRHFMQWFSGETDEDHAAAVFFNITEAEMIKWKQTNQKKEV